MRWFGHRLCGVVAIAFVPMAAAVLITPAVSSAACDPNMSWNPTARTCTAPPPVPAWYTPAPVYAPSFAGDDVPPPPPKPWWSPYAPMWQAGFHQWGAYFTGTWVPY